MIARASRFSLGVASPGMVALQAPVELSGGLVSAPGLQEPPVRLVVVALWALDFSYRERGEFGLLLPDHLYRRDRELLLGHLHDRLPGLVRVSAVVTKVCDCDRAFV